LGPRRRQSTEDHSIPKTTKSSHQPKLRDQLLSRKEVLSLVPLSYPTIWSLMRRGLFPASRAIGEHKCAWLASEVATWIVSRPIVKLKPYVELDGTTATRDQPNKKSKRSKKKPRR
jgi:predicted DNA-binding transcriptional regulator AlpA